MHNLWISARIPLEFEKVEWSFMMRRIKEWQEKKQPIEAAIILLVLFGAVITGLVVYLMVFSPKWFLAEGEKYKNIELIKVLLLSLGGLGALYGLILGAKRINNAQEQLFNERLGRGAKFLADKNMNMRRVGVRVLADLANTSSLKKVDMIMEIIYDFIEANSQRERKKDAFGNTIEAKAVSRLMRQDIELAMEIVSHFSEKIGVRRDFAYLDLRNLHISWKMNFAIFFAANLENAEFYNAQFVSADFSRANMKGTNFFDSNIGDASFISSKIHGTSFSDLKMGSACFDNASINDVHFSKMHLQSVTFKGADLKDVDFMQANLCKSDFYQATLDKVRFLGARLQGADFSSAQIKNPERLTQEQLNGIIFVNGMAPNISSRGLLVPENRAYTFDEHTDGRQQERRFIKSDAPWSEQPVDQWIEKEIAESEKR